MKIIFLDIDGVLNYELMWKEKRQADRYKELPKDAPDGAHDICEKKIDLLNSLVRETKAKVVISSTWRRSNTVDELRNLFYYKGFNGIIIDSTPSLYFANENYNYSVPRGCEIKAWLEMNKEILGDKMSKVRYVIFDDDSDMMYWQRANFFRVDPYCGLTPNIIHRAAMFLNK